jgi:hypothetical protein
MELNAQQVLDTFSHCLFKDGEVRAEIIEVHAVRHRIGFHAGRVKEKEILITGMLDELPDEFKNDKGGGWSFLNACNDRHGRQWADMQDAVDKLICLGLAIKKVEFLLPREDWKSFHGGMPYLRVL